MFDGFPNINLCGRLGIYSYNGTNPVDMLSIYREAFTHGEVTYEQLIECSDLNKLLMENCPSVKRLTCYDRVHRAGGIKPMNEPQFECPNCMFCTIHYGPICSNCHKSLKNED